MTDDLRRDLIRVLSEHGAVFCIVAYSLGGKKIAVRESDLREGER